MCGKPDAARMGSTEWGHDWICCSDECGKRFTNSPKRWALEVNRAEVALDFAKDKLESCRRQLQQAKDREAEALLDHVMDIGQ